MAGHYPLSKIDEPAVFETAKGLSSTIARALPFMGNFDKLTKSYNGKRFHFIKLSPDYVEDPTKEVAFMVGDFSLVSITDEHPSLTKGVDLEVHYKKEDGKLTLSHIYWVA